MPDVVNEPKEPLVLLTHTQNGAVGLKVDDVRRIVTLTPEELLPAPSSVRGICGESLVAIAPHDNEVFLVLDIDSLLTSDEQQQLQSVRG